MTYGKVHFISCCIVLLGAQRIQNLRFRSVFYISNETLLKKAIARDNAVLAQSSVVDPDPYVLDLLDPSIIKQK
jgi:hypothetical protein